MFLVSRINIISLHYLWRDVWNYTCSSNEGNGSLFKIWSLCRMENSISLIYLRSCKLFLFIFQYSVWNKEVLKEWKRWWRCRSRKFAGNGDWSGFGGQSQEGWCRRRTWELWWRARGNRFVLYCVIDTCKLLFEMYVCVCVWVVVDKVTVGQAFVQIFWFSLVTTILPMLHTHISFIYHHCYIILATDSFIK